MRDVHFINLCRTVEAKPEYITLPCVPRPKPNLSFPLNPDAEYDRRHEWSDGNKGRDGGVCAHCARTSKEVRVRVNPKTNRPVRNLAREIAGMFADVPPVRFMEGGHG